MTCILVVDDEPAVLKVLVTRLNLAGYQVLSAQDGEQALEVFHKEAPDLVVLEACFLKWTDLQFVGELEPNLVAP